MTTKQQEEMSKRFEQEFSLLYGVNVSVLNSEPVLIGNPPVADVLAFLQSEIDLAVAEEKKRYQKYLLHHYENYGIESVIEILSIIKNNPTK